MVEETANRPVIRFCVDLYRAADYLLLKTMLPIILCRLGDHCDGKLKWMCTRGNKLLDHDQTAMLWTKDLVDGIHEAYRWNSEPIKKTLMEFVWVGRRGLLGNTWTGIGDDLDKTPAFVKDMFRHSFGVSWKKSTIWAPITSSLTLSHPRSPKCARCDKKLRKLTDSEPNASGQVWDPFTVSTDNQALREWCKECSAMNMIPWRENAP